MNVLASEIQRVVESAIVTDNVDELGILGSQKTGEVHNIIASQGGTKDFRNVSQLWAPQCLTFDQGKQVLANQQANILDIKAPLSAWEPVVNANNQFALKYKATGREYVPTEHAVTNMCMLGQGSTWAITDLMADKAHRTKEDVIQWKRDGRDARVLVEYVKLMLFQNDRVPQDKIRLFRTWDNDNTLRALLSKDYTIVPNMWVLETVEKLIPGGLLSHWKGDADELFGNVLIPDSIRKEDDSDYGGMLSIGNSEIGTRRVTSVPSVFRAICMNGCIWDHEMGKGIDQVHRRKDGELDLDNLSEQIKTNLERQIPLIAAGIRMVLATKGLGFNKVPARNVLAATVQRLKIGKKMLSGIKEAYGVESVISGDSAFTVMQALTRYGQTLKNPVGWIGLDMAAGSIARMERKQWDLVLSYAAQLNDKDLEKMGV